MARIKPTMTKALNAQFGRELAASQQYLAMSIWLDTQSLEYLGAFLARQAEEEREHAMKFLRYMVEVGEQPVVPELAKPKATFRSLKQVVETALRQERAVTDAIHKLVDSAARYKDHATFQFLQWFVDEQIEEEATFSKLLDVIAIAQNTLQVENYVRHMQQADAEADAGAEV